MTIEKYQEARLVQNEISDLQDLNRRFKNILDLDDYAICSKLYDIFGVDMSPDLIRNEIREMNTKNDERILYLLEKFYTL